MNIMKIPFQIWLFFYSIQGTNVTEARKILDSSGMLIETAENLEDAAKKAVSSFR